MAAAQRTPTALRLLATARRRPSPHAHRCSTAPSLVPPPPPPRLLRELHASAARRASGDTSTIDYAFLPDMEYFPREERAAWIRIPVEPDATVAAPEVAVGGPGSVGFVERPPVDEPTLKPEINLMSADGTHINTPSAMSEVHDNTAVVFEGVHDEEPNGGDQAHGDTTLSGAMRQLWNDVMDDLAGSKATNRAVDTSNPPIER